MIVAWRSGSLQGVSRMGTMALGGLFLQTPTPPSKGSMLELLFEIAVGSQVRARAVVRNSIPGKGMGVKFVHMQAEDRSRLNKFLKTQMEAGNIQEELIPDDEQLPALDETDSLPDEQSADGAPAASPAGRPEAPASTSSEVAQKQDEQEEVAEEQVPVQGIQQDPSSVPEPQPRPENRGNPAQQDSPAQDDSEVSDEELARYLALSEKSNHYHLLGVTFDASSQEIKKGFYALARKFHPDRHMNRPNWVKPLQQLMGAITEAHNVLGDEIKRGHYDRKLIHRQTEVQETVEECVKLAANALRDENREGAIFWMRKCVNISPNEPKHRVSLASCLAAVPHHRREAVEHFQKAIELDQWNTDAYLQCGELYEMIKLPWRAASLYSKILEFDPGHVLARQRLARSESTEKGMSKKRPRLAKLFSRK
jgi:curved DNA-binding protein CbpA